MCGPFFISAFRHAYIPEGILWEMLWLSTSFCSSNSQSKSCVQNSQSPTYWTPLGSLLLAILFVVFIDRISNWSLGEEVSRLREPLLFAVVIWLCWMREFKSLCVDCDDGIEWEMDGRIKGSSAVICTLLRSAVWRKTQSKTGSYQWSVYVLTFIHG